MARREKEWDRKLRELRARQERGERVQLGLAGCVFLLIAFLVWAVFFRGTGGPGAQYKTMPSAPRQPRLQAVSGRVW